MDKHYVYKGWGFVTPQEVAWAAFFDALGLGWRYGTAGLGLDHHNFMGTVFYLPDLDKWVESRPWPAGHERGEFYAKHQLWNFSEGARLYVMSGMPTFGMNTLGYDAFRFEEGGYLWQQCDTCACVDIYKPHQKRCEYCPGRISAHTPAIESAYAQVAGVMILNGPCIPGRGPDDTPIYLWRN